MNEISYPDFEQDWKNYRTWFKESLAVVSVNMAIIESFTLQRMNAILHIDFSYSGDHNGLPKERDADEVFRQILSNMAQLCALPDVCYAGHILSNNRVQQFFYFKEEAPLKEALQQLNIENHQIQSDPNWDTFFEFLLPSPLENKMSITEELLDSLSENRVDLAVPQQISHRFHFDDKENVERFIEKCGLSQIPFVAIKYSDKLIEISEHKKAYLLKIDQELILNSQQIFEQVEQFELLAEQYFAQYLGWEYEGFGQQGNYLN